MREVTHGTVHAYRNLKCRCEDCREAATEQRRRERATRDGRTYTGPPSQATRIQKPDGWPASAFDRLERAL